MRRARGHSRCFLPLLAAATLLSCDPIMSVRTQVRSVPDGAGRTLYDGAAPVYAARVSIVCADGEPLELGTTDTSGEHRYTNIGWLPCDCSVRVEADGYFPEEQSLRELCVPPSSRSHFAVVFAELVPRRVPARVPGGAGIPATVAAPVRIEFHSQASKIEVYTRSVTDLPPDQDVPLACCSPVAYDAAGGTPVTLDLLPGRYRIAAAVGEAEPVEAPSSIELTRPSRIELRHTDRSAERTWKKVALLGGIVVGSTLLGVGSQQEGTAKLVLIGSGVVLAFTGVLLGVSVSETKDELAVEVKPLQ
jgi:hypothetical protein